MKPLKEVYREVATLECEGRGHVPPWPCAACLGKYANFAIDQAVAEEREACAKEVESFYQSGYGQQAGFALARRIRARGEPHVPA